MSWHERIIAAHLAVTDQFSHAQRMQSERYFVWQEDGQNDFLADGQHVQRAVTGTTDLFTKTEFDPWKAQFERALDDTAGIAWRLNLVDFEADTGFYHYEWVWQVVDGG